MILGPMTAAFLLSGTGYLTCDLQGSRIGVMWLIPYIQERREKGWDEICAKADDACYFACTCTSVHTCMIHRSPYSHSKVASCLSIDSKPMAFFGVEIKFIVIWLKVPIYL